MLTESKGMLYYFKSPDDPPELQGRALAAGLQDRRPGRRRQRERAGRRRRGWEERLGRQGRASAPRAGASTTSTAALLELLETVGTTPPPLLLPSSPRPGSFPSVGGASLLFRISHRDPTRAVYKNHASLVLRAESASEKFSWLARLRAAAANAANAAPLDTNPAASPRNGCRPAGERRGQESGGGGVKRERRRGREHRRTTLEHRRCNSFFSSPPPQSPPATQQPRPATIPASGIGSALAHGVSSKLGPEPPYVYGPSLSTSSSSMGRLSGGAGGGHGLLRPHGLRHHRRDGARRPPSTARSSGRRATCSKLSTRP